MRYSINGPIAGFAVGSAGDWWRDSRTATVFTVPQWRNRAVRGLAVSATRRDGPCFSSDLSDLCWIWRQIVVASQIQVVGLACKNTNSGYIVLWHQLD